MAPITHKWSLQLSKEWIFIFNLFFYRSLYNFFHRVMVFGHWNPPTPAYPGSWPPVPEDLVILNVRKIGEGEGEVTANHLCPSFPVHEDKVPLSMEYHAWNLRPLSRLSRGACTGQHSRSTSGPSTKWECLRRSRARRQLRVSSRITTRSHPGWWVKL